MSNKLIISISLILIAIAGYFWIGNSSDQSISYNFQIRPILSENCFLCHGPDISSREAGLRLDLRDSATSELESGNIAIVPFDASQSELVKRITHHDPEEKMPPEKLKRVLSEDDIDLIKKWINDGAKYEPYWAFVPPEERSSSVSKFTHPIDNYLASKQKEKHLKKVGQATSLALLRRLAYKIIGLPPTIEEIQLFEPFEGDWYDKATSYYLDSPHFGEKWARHWMDLVRYAEGKGHEFDFTIGGAWNYRDYLIRAFNLDIGYDQIVIEHLAGDMIDPRIDPESLNEESALATAYYYLAEGKHSPVDIKQEEADLLDNVIDVTSKTFQALTVSCSRCHDHKFDPIPTKDYYSMYGIFESSRIVPVPVGQNEFKKAEMLRVNSISKQNKSDLLEYLGHKPTPKIVLTSTNEEEEKSTFPHHFREDGLGGWLTQGPAYSGKNPIGTFPPNSRMIIETAASSREYGEGMMGSLSSSTFIIKDKYLIAKVRGKHAIARVVIDNFQIIQNPILGGLEKKINKPEWSILIFDLEMWKGHKAYIEFLNGEYLKHEFKIFNDSWMECEYVTTSSDPKKILEPVKNNQSSYVLFNAWESDVLDGWQAQRINKYLTKVPAKVYSKIQTSLFDSIYVMGMMDGDEVFSPVFQRGSYKQPSQEKVQHKFFKCLPYDESKFTQKGSNRLAFAESVASKDNPLTARVMVNRIWHHLYGRGIVSTVDNFGLQGTLPTHPKLLDHLAIYFMDNDWSIKKLISYIVRTENFRLSSVISDQNNSKDPENKWLTSFPVIRIESEGIRDGILTASGRLNKTLYGKPVPIYLDPFMEGRGKPPQVGPLDGDGRRSIYIAIRRNFLSPFMLVFDTPIPFSTFGKRNVTNVPAQSLTMMNDPFVKNQAEFLAEFLDYSLSDEELVKNIYLRLFTRTPNKEEIDKGISFIQNMMERNTSENAKENAWQEFCHTLFNTKEFIYLM